MCSVATTNKRVKILDFKLFYKHFVFVDKGNFDVKKVLKRNIDVNVFVDVVCVSENEYNNNYLSQERTIEFCSPFLFLGRKMNGVKLCSK